MQYNTIQCNAVQYNTKHVQYLGFMFKSKKKTTFDRLRVAFNNTYRRVLSQPWRCSASAIYANFGINNFETTIRKSTYGFIQRMGCTA